MTKPSMWIDTFREARELAEKHELLCWSIISDERVGYFVGTKPPPGVHKEGVKVRSMPLKTDRIALDKILATASAMRTGSANRSQKC